ncbi:MAG TPA: phenylalanine--tRNA ligase subunit beta [Solirubrobacteraceae bacterium]|jgi:phenylalanyl-tRNA synthetase beta chain|nr:phenylalanine--tRNA ligase subunit beta [Solirubrobacteraceae bacterium]
MRVPLGWLREYCDPDLDVRGIEERLTMTGTKVEAIHHYGVREPERFVVGRVLTCERHPDADRLSVCTVDLGCAAPDGPATIVCGAPNVAAGQTVAVACPGAVMPDGTKIKRAKLRGVASAGMILAERELAIGDGREGIIVLDELLRDGQIAGGQLPAPGTPLAQVLPLADEVVELEITPNRPDCLGVYGVARELHAATGAPLTPAPWQQDPGSGGPLRAAPDTGSAAGVPDAGAPSTGAPPAVVQVECPDLCPRFTARVFENVTLGQSPPWLKARLSAAGQRPINNVVDITNYVMLATAQPLHAFDLDRVAGARLTVRRADDGEQVQTLDGQTRTLDEQMVVIEDAEGPTSIAGLMGGARSEVGEGTTRVLLEVATWDGPNIHRTGWALGLRSEASARFEKGLAPAQCDYAQALATRLLIDLCGATVLAGTIDLTSPEADVEQLPSPHVPLREARVHAILGVPVPRARQREILHALDFQTQDSDDGLDVTVPPLRRADITREADLIEEVARIDGLEKLPATLPPRRPAGRLAPTQRLRRRAVDALVGRGLYETVGWTFTAPATLAQLRLAPTDPRRAGAVALENPLSEEHALLRTTLLGSLLDSAAHNAARGQRDLGLFEVGTVFASRPQPRPPDPTSSEPFTRVFGPDRGPLGVAGVHEHRALGVLLSGRVTPATWQAPDPPRADLYAVKGILEALGDALRVPLDYRPAAGSADGDATDRAHEEEHLHPFLHPGRAAAVFAGEQPIGWLGELHPFVAGWELDGAAVAEIDLDRLIAAAEEGVQARRYRDLISFPALRQDIAVILPVEVPAAAAIAVVCDAAGKLLHEARVFDVYSGPQVGEGRRSLALALSYRAPDRTLADTDVAPVRERILTALREQLGGELRG